ncbi:hypothetical protein F5Y16DRAFT_356020 [Xylariaceae sp. FL0255]|nr:hypothetical protein F5Y16DRAFT_356020 [Xylariaceae sp. FL0255]
MSSRQLSSFFKSAHGILTTHNRFGKRPALLSSRLFSLRQQFLTVNQLQRRGCPRQQRLYTSIHGLEPKVNLTRRLESYLPLPKTPSKGANLAESIRSLAKAARREFNGKLLPHSARKNGDAASVLKHLEDSASRIFDFQYAYSLGQIWKLPGENTDEETVAGADTNLFFPCNARILVDDRIYLFLVVHDSLEGVETTTATGNLCKINPNKHIEDLIIRVRSTYQQFSHLSKNVIEEFGLYILTSDYKIFGLRVGPDWYEGHRIVWKKGIKTSSG